MSSLVFGWFTHLNGAACRNRHWLERPECQFWWGATGTAARRLARQRLSARPGQHLLKRDQ